MKIIPINKHLVVEPAHEKSSFQSAQQSYEERGKVIALPHVHGSEVTMLSGITVGCYVFFDSWCTARYKDGEGKEFWVVPLEKIRAIESDEQ